ncbi:MAG: YybH family protein [Actinomycetota bacterium]
MTDTRCLLGGPPQQHRSDVASFNCQSSAIDLVAADVSGDLAYTVHREITSTSVDGEPSGYVLRVTQVYRREDGEWKVVHRHGDRDPEET